MQIPRKIMSKATLQTQLHYYLEQHPKEKETVNQVIQFMRLYDRCFDRDNWYGHFTGSAWIVDQTRDWVLMTNHRQLDMWLQLGGHADGNIDLLAVALKEAREESGLTKFNVLSEQIFDLDIHQIPVFNEIPSHLHFDIRFIIETKHDDKNILVSDESHDVAWVHKSDVRKKNSEESIARMLKKMERRYS